MEAAELQKVFDDYFRIFPWDRLNDHSEGFDMGCGSGRWAKLVAPRVGILHCVDPSAAVDVARKTLEGQDNVRFHRAALDSDVLSPGSQDFGYSLGVLHHVPDTAQALRTCASYLKPGAPFLVYLYYALDNRPAWYRAIWRASDAVRRAVHGLPARLKSVVTDAIAISVYWPLARFALLAEKLLGDKAANLPLFYYRNHSFYTMRTDARDRFGTPLEQRFTKAQITRMMTDAGLTDIRFSDAAPYWCAVGYRT
jgi:SAM-dependent methyltransferase